MHRPAIYGGQVPADTDLLNAETETLVAIANLTQDLLFNTLNPANITTPSAIAGFQPSYPGGMQIALAAGRIYQLAAVDTTPFVDRPSDARLVIQQGQAETQTLTFAAAPGVAGQSRIDLVQITYSVADDRNTVLPYYNSSNPAVPYSGPNNTGTAQATRRSIYGTLSIKAGVAGVAPVAPTADAGAVPVFTVTVPFGAVALSGANLAVHASAPFVGGLLRQHHTGAPGSAPQIDLTSEVQNRLAAANLPLVAEVTTNKGAANGYAGLDGTGKVPVGQLPTLVTSHVFTVASAAAMTALAATQGDIAIRTDFTPNQSYILATTDPTQAANWVEFAITSQTSTITSVFGRVGVITAQPGDIPVTSIKDLLITTANGTGGLNISYNGCPNYLLPGESTPLNIPTGTLALPANSTCYVYVSALGVVTYTPVSAGFSVDGAADPMGIVVTGPASITTVSDARGLFGGANTLGLGTRMKDQVASQTDCKIVAGVERIPLITDTINGLLVARDKRITLSGPWVYSPSLSGSAYQIPLANPAVSGTGNTTNIATNVPSSTFTHSFQGTGLNLVLAKLAAGGTFTVSIDGGAATTYDTYANIALSSFGQVTNIASGLANGPHTALITVTGTKGGAGAATDAQVVIYATEIIGSTAASLNYTTGTAFPTGVQTAIPTAGSLTPTAIGAALYRRDLVYLTKGSSIPAILAGYSGAAADTLATFKANNVIKYRVEAEDTTGKLANVWATALSLYTVNSAYSGGGVYALGNATTNSDASGTDYIVCGFIGTGANLLTIQANGQGIFAYSVDGGAETLVDNYQAAGTTQNQVSINVAYNLPYGYHQIKIRKTGTKNAASSNYYVNVDAFDIYMPATPALPANSMPLGELLVTPTNGWIRHSSAAEWVYTGVNWGSGANPGDTGGVVKTNANTNTTDAASVTFTGTQCRLLVNTANSLGKVNVSIDGGAAVTVDTYSAATVLSTVVFTSAVLAAGVHTVTVTMTNTKNASNVSGTQYFNLDAIEVIPLPLQPLDTRNVYAADQTPITQAINDHLNNQRHPANYAQSVTGYVATTSTVFVTNQSATFTSRGNTLQIVWAGGYQNNTAGQTVILHIVVDGLAVYDTDSLYCGVAGAIYPFSIPLVLNVPAGMHTILFQQRVSGGTGGADCIYIINEL
jgi:hypothetical protein